jgi:hypothetical protein
MAGLLSRLKAQLEDTGLYQFFDINDRGQLFEGPPYSFLRRVDIGFGGSRRRVSQDALDDEDIDILIVEVGGEAVAKGMAGDVEGHTQAVRWGRATASL